MSGYSLGPCEVPAQNLNIMTTFGTDSSRFRSYSHIGFPAVYVPKDNHFGPVTANRAAGVERASTKCRADAEQVRARRWTDGGARARPSSMVVEGNLGTACGLTDLRIEISERRER